jgi:hypothetical protein
MGLLIFVSSSVQKLEPNIVTQFFRDFPKNSCYLNPYWPICKKKILTLFSDFLFLKTHFRIGRHENEENTFSTLVLELFFPSIAN